MKKILLLLLCFFLTGCYDYKDLNEITIVSGIGIDKKEDNYVVSLQVVNTKKGDNVKPKYYVYSAKGKNIQQAINNITNSSALNIYTNHIDILLISEEIAKDNISHILDFFYRNSNIRIEFLPLICKDYSCKDILELETTLVPLNSKSIKEAIENNKVNRGNVKDISFSEFLNDYLNEKNDISIPAISITNKKITLEDTNVSAYPTLKNMTYFKNNKLIDYLTFNQSLSYNFILNNISNVVLTVPYDKDFCLEFIDSKTDTSFKDGTIKIKINSSASLSEYNSSIKLNKKGLKKVKETANNYIKKNIINTINFLNGKESDILKFRDLIYKTDPNYYKKLKSLKDIKYEVDVDVNIINTENGLKEVYND